MNTFSVPAPPMCIPLTTPWENRRPPLRGSISSDKGKKVKLFADEPRSGGEEHCGMASA